MRVSRVLGGVAVMATVGAVASAGLLAGAGSLDRPQKKTTDRLTRFGSCTALRTYASRHAMSMMSASGYGPYSVRWVGGQRPMFREVAPQPTGIAPQPTGAAPDTASAPPTAVPTVTPAPAAPAADASGTQGVDYSGTNVQEAGVDEPDIVVSDAQHIYTTSGDALRILAAGDTPTPVGALKLPGIGSDAQLLKVGDRLLVLTAGDAYAYPTVRSSTTSPAPAVDVAPSPGVAVAPSPPTTAAPRLAVDRYMPSTPETVVRLVDIADPAHPRLVETLKVDGRLLGARRPANGAVRLVIQSTPDPVPMYGIGSKEAPTWMQASVRNRAILKAQPARTWLPSMQVTKPGKKAVTRTAVGCRDVARATQFGGLDTLVVLTIDPSTGLTPVDRDAVMTDGEIIYGSGTSLFVTTPRWIDSSSATTSDVPSGARTQIHRFDISMPSATGYSASGSVPGYVLNQFSLSEYDGVLRVASTNEPQWMDGEQAKQSESQVTTLAQDGRRLVERGKVTGLGVSERIYGVRFVGTLGYVVTFRQMDPLYVIDLRDPAHPVARGELKIPGYSAYLHPVGHGLLLGVGQNATDEGRPLGTQISLFDVSNPDAPRRVQNLTLPDGWSEAENDHHAFLYWAPTGLAMVPVNSYAGGRPQSEAVGVKISKDGITRIRTISHPKDADDMVPTLRRSMVIGDRVFTLSDGGVGASRLDNLSPLGFTAFG